MDAVVVGAIVVDDVSNRVDDADAVVLRVRERLDVADLDLVMSRLCDSDRRKLRLPVSSSDADADGVEDIDAVRQTHRLAAGRSTIFNPMTTRDAHDSHCTPT